LPVPLAPEVIVSQFAPLDAVHVQPDVVETVAVPVPPPAPDVALVGVTMYEHPVAWLIMNAWLPTLIEPLRAAPELAATTKLSVPLPLVPEPAATVIHEALGVAFHAQPLPDVTLVDPLPPSTARLALDGESEYVHVDPEVLPLTRKFATV
jgi:hypothetical protein